jgi:phosphatidylserine/phosphatidylglycerophosphate/cardiolipin synthase-like enzyme/uncharacterized membrane protein YdjX (TVP38/TMEM64 family)
MPENTGNQAWGELLTPGHNCWKLLPSGRSGVLVESSTYFDALHDACEQARELILIVGWDFDRREKFGRGPDALTFENYFCQLLERRPQLQVWLLSWDYTFVYAAEREWFQEQRLQHFTHERFHAWFDGEHPLWASQHQKFVVIDDGLAFSGGIDLSRWRWDTREHAPGDERRLDPGHEPYQPFHDVMLMLDGPAARALGELARVRWSESGAPQPPPPLAPAAQAAGDEVPWPDYCEVSWDGQEIAIARTFPGHGKRAEVREVEQLYLDSVACAQRYIYIENQYFTSRSLAAALASRLQAPSGPEIIIVLPEKTGGWLEQVTMDKLRDRRIRELRSADSHGRLRVLFPHQPGLADDECIMVHAKLMIADDCFVRIGSANTSNRSMGMDSECDLALVDQAGDGARALLRRLLAEHLDVSDALVDERLADESSLLKVVDALASNEGRSLRRLEVSDQPQSLDISEQEDLVDPDEPIDAEWLVARAVPPGSKPGGRRRLYGFLSLLLLLLLLGAAWRWTPLGDWASARQLAEGLAFFDSPAARFLTVSAVIVVTSLLMMPLSILVVASALLLGPWAGFAASMLSALVSAAIAFVVGDLSGGKILEHYGQSRVHKLSQKLSDRGVLAVAVVRLMPIAPYTVVNVVAGASHLSLSKFLAGSAIGLVPGVAAVTFFSGSLFQAVQDPGPRSLVILLVVMLAIVGGALLLRRMLRDS